MLTTLSFASDGFFTQYMLSALGAPDVLGDLLDALEARGLALPARRKWQKASTWALTWDGDRLAKATYLPPPSV